MPQTRKRKKRPLSKNTALSPQEEKIVAQHKARQTARLAQQRRTMIFLIGLFVLALLLRVANLTTQSLWADEGNSVRLTERPFQLVIDAARADVHPPGYYVLLWLWAKLFGQGEVAVRALSVLIGLLVVGLVYLVGKRLFGPRAAWLAGFCAAMSPFQVVYSQEVRMYILVAFWGALALYAFVRWLDASARRARTLWSFVYALALAGGLWTHYSFPIVIVALGVTWLIWWLRQPKDTAWRHAGILWLGTHFIVLGLYIPWLSVALERILNYGAISTGQTLALMASQAFKLLSIGEHVPDDAWTRWLTIGIVAIAAFGAWSGFVPDPAAQAAGRRPADRFSPHRSTGTAALLWMVAAPLIMLVVLSLVGRAAYRPKFFLVASPAFCLLAGEGIALLERTESGTRGWQQRLWLLLGLGLVTVGAMRTLYNYYFDPAYARSDYRGMAQEIDRLYRPGDAVLLNAPNQWEVFTYYYQEGRNRAPVYPLCRERPPVESTVYAELETIVEQHDRLFVLYWASEQSDPERIVERWLETNTFKANDTWYGDVRLVVYAVPKDLETISMTESLPDVQFGDDIMLRGYTRAPERMQRGDILQLTLFWEALSVPQERYKVFVHLVDEQGQITTQFDGEPGDGMNLTTLWRPDQGVFPDRYGLLVPTTALAGKYRLLVGLYDLESEPRLSVTVDGEASGDVLTLATLQID